MVKNIIIAIGSLAFMVVSGVVLAQGQNDSSGRVADYADDIHPLLVGMSVPDVVLTDIQGKQVNYILFSNKSPQFSYFIVGGGVRIATFNWNNCTR